MNYTLGIDVSIYQENVDWQAAVTAGARFVYVRGAYGVSKDGLFDTHWTGSLGKLYRGVYLYYKDIQDPVQQAQNLYNYCAAHGNFGELPPALDVETDFNPTLTPSKIKACLEKMKALWQPHGLEPIIYTRTTVWNPLIGNVAWAADYDLWCAHYPWAKDKWKDEYIETAKQLDPAIWPTNPSPWKTRGIKQVFWQITGYATASLFGVSGNTLDVNYFSGTEQELSDYANGTINPPPPDPEPEGNDVMQKMKCVTLGSFINIRNKPTANSIDVGNFNKNETAFHFPAKKVVVKAELPNKEIWRAGLFADGTLGYVAEWHPTLKNASGQQYAAIVDIEPPEPCGEGEPMTPEQLARLEYVENTLEAMQNASSPFVPTNRLETTKPGGEKLRAYPNGSEAVQLYDNDLLMDLNQTRAGQKLVAHERNGIIITGFLDPAVIGAL